MEWLGIVLGAGGVAMVGALVQAYKMLRDQSEAKRVGAIADLEKWRKEAFADAEWQRARAGHWMARSGALEFLLRRNGIDIPPATPEPARPEEPADD